MSIRTMRLSVLLDRGKTHFLFLMKGWRKFLLAYAMLMLALFCVYFQIVLASSEQRAVWQQAWEKKQDVDLLCGIVEKLLEMDRVYNMDYRYDEVLQYAVSYIESNYTSTYAQLFNESLEALTPLSPGVGGGKKHNPLDYPEFVEAVATSESGSLTYWYGTSQAGGREVHMTFRWVPTDAAHSSRYLIAVGISKYTIQESMNPWMAYGTVALILSTSVFIIGVTVLSCRLGYYYDTRREDIHDGKWRGRLEDAGR